MLGFLTVFGIFSKDEAARLMGFVLLNYSKTLEGPTDWQEDLSPQCVECDVSDQ